MALSEIGGRAYDLIKLNPLTGLFEAFRAVLLYGERPAAWELAYPTFVAVVLLVALRAGLPARGAALRQARMSVASVTCAGLGVRFQFDRQRRVVSPIRPGCGARARSWGLRDVTISIEGGESVALLGPSGAGKTTLLRTIGGVLPPDEARSTRGRIASLLSVDAGLTPVLTGRENAVLLRRARRDERRDARRGLAEIRDGTGIGDAFDHPVSSYSQGMRARLGFSVSPRGRRRSAARRGARSARPRLPRHRRGVHDGASAGRNRRSRTRHSLLERICGARCCSSTDRSPPTGRSRRSPRRMGAARLIAYQHRLSRSRTRR